MQESRKVMVRQMESLSSPANHMMPFRPSLGRALKRLRARQVNRHSRTLPNSLRALSPLRQNRPPANQAGESSLPQAPTTEAPSQKSKAEDQPTPEQSDGLPQATAQVEHPAYFDQVPENFEPRQDAWLVVPMYHVFGSEELSVLSPGIAELSPQPYLAVNIEDAAAIINVALLIPGPGAAPQAEGIVQLESELTLDRFTYHLPVRLTTGLPRGVVGLPVGLPGLSVFALPAYGTLKLKDKGGKDAQGASLP
jgi:hypothetical protein